MVVTDANVAIKWLIPEPPTDKADALLNSVLRMREQIVAPQLLPFEITNVLRQRMIRTGLSLVRVTNALAVFQSLPISLSSDVLHRRALELADRFALPAAYDSQYIALAERLGCRLWTDDQRLLNTLCGGLPSVRWIGDFQGVL